MLKRIASISQNEQGDILNINDVISPKKGPEQILKDLLHLVRSQKLKPISSVQCVECVNKAIVIYMDFPGNSQVRNNVCF